MSDTSIPDWPHLRNVRPEPSSVPGFRTLSNGSLSRFGIGWPCRLASSGFGSHVSTWLGPPYMNRKMHDFALAAKCGDLGASGEALRFGSAAARDPKKPSPASRNVIAVEIKPPPISHKNSLRLRPQGVVAIVICILLYIKEFVAVQ